jgi:hypothetical protein
MSKRGTSLGYGHKTMGEDNNKFVPGVGAYSFKSSINPEENKQRSFTFGVSREVQPKLGRKWNPEDL